MPRVNTVKRSAKDQGTCNRCSDALPKGSAYRWIKFRYGGKRTRCMKPACQFRSSDLTSSDKLSRIYGAQEDAEDSLGALDTGSLDEQSDCDTFAEDVKQIVHSAGETVKEVGEEYQESADNIRENFSESPTADECEEKAQELESWGDTLEEFEPDGFEFEDGEFKADDVERDDDATDEKHAEKVEKAKDEHEEKLSEAREAWADTVLEEAHNALGECPL